MQHIAVSKSAVSWITKEFFIRGIHAAWCSSNAGQLNRLAHASNSWMLLFQQGDPLVAPARASPTAKAQGESQHTACWASNVL
jgi:hypothetical protein